MSPVWAEGTRGRGEADTLKDVEDQVIVQKLFSLLTQTLERNISVKTTFQLISTCSRGLLGGSWRRSSSCWQFPWSLWSTEHSPGEERTHPGRQSVRWWCPTLWCWRSCPGSDWALHSSLQSAPRRDDSRGWPHTVLAQEEPRDCWRSERPGGNYFPQ